MPDGSDIPLSEQWCRAADVAELERVLAESQSNHTSIVTALQARVDELVKLTMEQDVELAALRTFYNRCMDEWPHE